MLKARLLPSIVLVLGSLLGACGAQPTEHAGQAREQALESKDGAATFTEKDYQVLLEKCQLESKADCEDADPKGTDDWARRVCSRCRDDGTAQVCCRDQIINGIRVQSCDYEVKCSCQKVWTPIYDFLICEYIDQVV